MGTSPLGYMLLTLNQHTYISICSPTSTIGLPPLGCILLCWEWYSSIPIDSPILKSVLRAPLLLLYHYYGHIPIGNHDSQWLLLLLSFNLWLLCPFQCYYTTLSNLQLQLDLFDSQWQSSAWIQSLLSHCTISPSPSELLFSTQHFSSCAYLFWGCFPFRPHIAYCNSYLGFNCCLAINFWWCCEILQIEHNNIGVKCHTMTWYKSFVDKGVLIPSIRDWRIVCSYLFCHWSDGRWSE